MRRFTMRQIKAFIKKAEKHNACVTELDKILSCKTVDDVYNHPDASHWCYWYAVKVLGKRFEEAEPIILKDLTYAYHYADDIKGRWLEVEDLILKHKITSYACLYAREVIKGRWLEAEEIILNDSYYSFLYAKDVLKGRWEDAEDVIKTEPRYAYFYALEILEGRFPKGEPSILTDSFYSFFYAKTIIKGPWPEAEEIINSDTNYKRRYARFCQSLINTEGLISGPLDVSNRT